MRTGQCQNSILSIFPPQLSKNLTLISQTFTMSGRSWFRICIHTTLTFIFIFIMYKNLQNWSHGQTNIAFSSSSAATLPYPSVTICPYSYNYQVEDIESITKENRLLGLSHIVDNKLDSKTCRIFCLETFTTFHFLQTHSKQFHPSRYQRTLCWCTPKL